MCAAETREILVSGSKPAPIPAAHRTYRARNPAGNPLNRLALDHLLEFKEWLKSAPSRKPRPHPAALDALERFTECGVLRYGAVRYRCPECGHDVFVAFSCKRRGVCPSCDAKRSAVITAAALDRLLPPARYRQWVLVIPKRLRYFLNTRPDLPGYLSKLLAREVDKFMRRRAPGVPAQLHFIQRFGGALNLHVHVHAVVSDGAFSIKDRAGRRELVFIPATSPDDAELAGIVNSIRRKLLRRLRDTGCLPAVAAQEMLGWENTGFSLHKDVVIEPRDRRGLGRLVRYCSRPALSPERLTYSAKARLAVYRTEPRPGQPAALVMDPLEFLRRWGLLLPPAHRNLVHYYGALAPRSPLRRALTAKAEEEAGKKRNEEESAEKLRKRASSWAACLARVFEVFPLMCPNCGIELKPVAAIFDDAELVRLLTRFGLPTEFPKYRPAPALPQYAAKRAPPDENCQLDPRVDQYDAIDPPALED